ncbi:Uncharacterised protein [Neisseria gonorrhoeae]|uniref:Uncharacterized protein n=1 Tax=Neisseria gonorrhoeae TaxID=485 RepID=A0A378VXY9_NEIGO|nr:Uncharacterised protein [Neisseria gonorrhoeae]
MSRRLIHTAGAASIFKIGRNTGLNAKKRAITCSTAWSISRLRVSPNRNINATEIRRIDQGLIAVWNVGRTALARNRTYYEGRLKPFTNFKRTITL